MKRDAKKIVLDFVATPFMIEFRALVCCQSVISVGGGACCEWQIQALKLDLLRPSQAAATYN